MNKGMKELSKLADHFEQMNKEELLDLERRAVDYYYNILMKTDENEES